MNRASVKNEKRKPRGAVIEQTALMQAIDDNPAAAMMALADEAQSDWENNAPPEWANLLQAQSESNPR